MNDAMNALAAQLGVPYVSPEALSTRTPDWTHLTLDEARAHNVWPLTEADGRTLFVLDRPAHVQLLSWLSARVRAPVHWGLAAPEAVSRMLNQNSTPSRTAMSTASASSVMAFVDTTVTQAWAAGASDIHFETRRSGLAIRIRRDGVLADFTRWEGAEAPQEVLSRLKVMAQLDIAERRVPQDGRFSLPMEGGTVDFRVSIMPNAYGEDAVLRILDKRHLMSSTGVMTLDGLGFHGATLDALRRLAQLPHGMLLVTGPTGSGKTTTLYAALSEILSGRDKVITIEDPIEYELPGALQIPVNESKGLTFARGLRSVLRHDPDTIFVGEIRDAETADIAVQAALTGHLVFTTVHANSVIDVIGRFIHMKLDLFSLVSALNGVVSQRLVRLVCPQCQAQAGTVEHCSACQGSGYQGRTVVAEAVLLDDRCRELIVERAPLTVLKEHLHQIATAHLHAQAQALIEAHRTTREEVARVLALV